MTTTPIAFIDIGFTPADNQAHLFCPHCGERHRFTARPQQTSICIGPCSCGLELVVNVSSPVQLNNSYEGRKDTMERLRGVVNHLADHVAAEQTPCGVAYWRPNTDQEKNSCPHCFSWITPDNPEPKGEGKGCLECIDKI